MRPVGGAGTAARHAPPQPSAPNGSGGRGGSRFDLNAFLERHGSRAPEVIWMGALAWIETAAADAKGAVANRWRHYPAGELKRLRLEIAGALELARFAVALQAEEDELERELVDAARVAAEEHRRRQKRAGTTEATRARQRRSRSAPE